MTLTFMLTLALFPLLDAATGSPSSQLSPRKGGGRGGGGGSKGGGKSSGSSVGKSVGVEKLGGKFTGTASSTSRGGGKPVVLSGDSPFAGRLSGGGTREQVYGTSRIGSGYPSPSNSPGSFYNGRGLPFGFWPVQYSSGGHNYYGGDEYGPSVDSTRPGGGLSVAILQPSMTSTPTSDPSFYIFGDAFSVAAVLDALVLSTDCTIANSTVRQIYGNDTEASSIVHPEQVVQYYRASSFALALSSYNNTAALPANAPSSNTSDAPPLSADTPLPAGLNFTLLECINNTIAENVPLLDLKSSSLSEGNLIAAIVLPILGAVVIGYIVYLCTCRRRQQRNTLFYLQRARRSEDIKLSYNRFGGRSSG